jgi:diaminopimelate epimerase
MTMAKTIAFAKMSGSGNDFIVFDTRTRKVKGDLAEFARNVCRRRVGIGADGIILIEKDDDCDFFMRYLNADGSEADMCGNGGRCAALFARMKEIAGAEMRFRTRDGVHEASIVEDSVKLRMRDPGELNLEMPLGLAGREVSASYVNTGVPHVVVAVEDVDKIDVLALGKEIRFLPKFQPSGTNADFVQVLSHGWIKVRTYERGVEDETLACGTGCVAAAVVTSIRRNLYSPIHCLTSGGEVLNVHFNKKDDLLSDIYLEGGAELIFEGKLPVSKG